MANIYELTQAYRNLEDALLINCDDEEAFEALCNIDADIDAT